LKKREKDSTGQVFKMFNFIQMRIHYKRFYLKKQIGL